MHTAGRFSCINRFISDENIPYFFHEFILIFGRKHASSAGRSRECDGIDGIDDGLMFRRARDDSAAHV
jgi:hypothetical protein